MTTRFDELAGISFATRPPPAATPAGGRNRATVIWTRGSYPDTDFVWLSQVP